MGYMSLEFNWKRWRCSRKIVFGRYELLIDTCTDQRVCVCVCMCVCACVFFFGVCLF